VKVTRVTWVNHSQSCRGYRRIGGGTAADHASAAEDARDQLDRDRPQVSQGGDMACQLVDAQLPQGQHFHPSLQPRRQHGLAGALSVSQAVGAVLELAVM
jgi:hypothetical protein